MALGFLRNSNLMTLDTIRCRDKILSLGLGGNPVGLVFDLCLSVPFPVRSCFSELSNMGQLSTRTAILRVPMNDPSFIKWRTVLCLH